MTAEPWVPLPPGHGDDHRVGAIPEAYCGTCGRPNPCPLHGQAERIAAHRARYERLLAEKVTA